MKTFYVLWTYVANYSRLIPIEAKDAVEALDRTCGLYNGNEDFKRKASVFVFDSPPAFVQYKGENMGFTTYREASKND